ncbi:GNAT family N-acetyltransferase [Peribacillus sp. SCS-26]|uniref:GNAT family N-acetyltransferase n=1 Tax=Paraperibacillus marinus TaxID=3115295 RepID=UPI0039058135
MRYSDRLIRVIRIAEREANSRESAVDSIHIWLGLLLENSGPLAEVNQQYSDLLPFMLIQAEKQPPGRGESNIRPFMEKVTHEISILMGRALDEMKRYNQVVMNEGHVIRGLCGLTHSLSEKKKEEILKIAAMPRDMFVHLENYQFPDNFLYKGEIRRAQTEDLDEVMAFIREEFGERWVSTAIEGFHHEEIPIRLSYSGGILTGFACYDITGKGVFGPMGTSIKFRQQGTGSALLHHCLKDMKRRGCDSIKIQQAGPIEFYEKACGARLSKSTFS